LKVKKILVSQPAPAVAEKSPYHELVLKHRVDVRFHPFIKLEGVTLKEFRSQRVEILEHSAVIFTSRTTIDNFFRICEQARITIPEGMKYFCNTEAVALYLQKYIVYRKRKIFFADGTFSALVELIAKHKDEKFLLTLSEPHKPELPMALEKMKLRFDKVILARTVSADLRHSRLRPVGFLQSVGNHFVARGFPASERIAANRHVRARHGQGSRRRGTDSQRHGPDSRGSVDDQGDRSVHP